MPVSATWQRQKAKMSSQELFSHFPDDLQRYSQFLHRGASYVVCFLRVQSHYEEATKATQDQEKCGLNTSGKRLLHRQWRSLNKGDSSGGRAWHWPAKGTSRAELLSTTRSTVEGGLRTRPSRNCEPIFTGAVLLSWLSL